MGETALSPLYTCLLITIWLICALYTYPSIPSFHPPPFLLIFLSYFSLSLSFPFLHLFSAPCPGRGFTLQHCFPQSDLVSCPAMTHSSPGLGKFFISPLSPPFQAYFNFLISWYLHPMPPLMTEPFYHQHLFTPAPQDSPTFCIHYPSIVSFPLFFSFSPIHFFFTVLSCFSFSCSSLLPGPSGGFMFWGCFTSKHL